MTTTKSLVWKNKSIFANPRLDQKQCGSQLVSFVRGWKNVDHIALCGWLFNYRRPHWDYSLVEKLVIFSIWNDQTWISKFFPRSGASIFA